MKHDANVSPNVPARQQPSTERNVGAASAKNGGHVLNQDAAVTIAVKAGGQLPSRSRPKPIGQRDDLDAVRCATRRRRRRNVERNGVAAVSQGVGDLNGVVTDSPAVGWQLWRDDVPTCVHERTAKAGVDTTAL